MKTETILKAIEVLDAARRALMRGDLSIEAQIKLGSECHSASFQLHRELTEELPEVKVAA